METKNVYRYDDKNYFEHKVILDDTDRSPVSGAWQIPAYCTEVEPPAEKEGFKIKWNGEGWEYEEEEPKEPEPPKPTFEELKKRKVRELKWERDRKETLPITYKDKSFDYDDKARERMRIAQQALEDNNIPSQTWTCADNSITELSVADFKALNTLAAQRSGQLHEQYNKLKVYIDTLKTIEAIEAVTFDTEVA